jgi:threonine dehydratase
MVAAAAASPTATRVPTFADIETAARRIKGLAVETPLIESKDLNDRTGGRLFIKPENLQRTGSFKFRGATNKIAALQAETQPPRHVVAFSSGNHAQGVAAAAQAAGIGATIVMPADAPEIKIANTRGYGAEVVFYDRYRDDREAITARIAQERRAAIVRPFDDPDIIAGQGTIGREVFSQLAQLGTAADLLLSPCGGGGLISGIALAMSELTCKTKIHAVEPAGFDDTARSLKAHARQKNAPDAKSICDALLSPMPGALTFSLNDRLLAGAMAVTDEEVLAAMDYGFRQLKLVTEPGGAVALAAALADKIDLKGKTAVIIISGGNVDPQMFARATGVAASLS